MEKHPIRTRVYIDGYNFYYGCLRGTSHKWLDLVALFEREILPSIKFPFQKKNTLLDFQEPAFKFFTAKIIEKAAKSVDSVACQARYHSALKKHHGDRLEIIEGYYAINEATAKLIDPENPKKWPKDCDEALYWKLEEKQSDVKLSLNLYHDALTDQIDHAIVVTNDTDVAPALEMVRDHTDVKLGLVVPSRDRNREPNASLVKHAHWVRRSISSTELRSSQLPRVVFGGKQPTAKPVSWYPRPDLLEPALKVAASVLGNKGKAFVWLSKPNKWLNDEAPLNLLESDEGAKKVMSYMQNYIDSNSLDRDG